jgi:hypothetical protein
MTQELVNWIREPRVINAVQIIAYALAAGFGFLAALGGIPIILNGTVGSVIAVGVGALLVIGGAVGAVAVCVGFWGLERIGLLVSGLGYVLMLFVTAWFAFTGRASTSTIWLIVGLEIHAICACIIRFRRIDWAYLDPTR